MFYPVETILSLSFYVSLVSLNKCIFHMIMNALSTAPFGCIAVHHCLLNHSTMIGHLGSFQIFHVITWK